MLVAVLLTVLPALAAARSALRPREVDGIGDVYQPLVPYYASTMHPCPQIAPAQMDLDQLLGPWHLSLLMLADRSSEGQPLLDDSMCATVELVRTNASMLRLDWQLRQLGLPAGLADLQLQVAAAVLGNAGLWALATPLGGEMLCTVTHASARSHLVLNVCGEQQGRRVGEGAEAVHVLTALLTRQSPSTLGSLELLRLSSLMLPNNGFRHVDERLLSWGQC